MNYVENVLLHSEEEEAIEALLSVLNPKRVKVKKEVNTSL